MDAAMAGILALLVDDREHRAKEDKSEAKTEVLLANAGVSVEGIATLTGKKPDAVRKSIQRARTS
jgi:hypothetical protein